MSQQRLRTVVTNFTELAAVLYPDLLATDMADDQKADAASVRVPDGPPTPPSGDASESEGEQGAFSLPDLLAELEAAGATLATIMRQDREARTLALRDLDRYDALVAQQQEADHIVAQARHVQQQAAALTEEAFTDEARNTASRVLSVAAQIAATALHLSEQRGQQAQALATELDLERLLAERRRQEEAEKAKAAQAERARRLSEALSGAQRALDAGHIREAEAVLGPLAKDHPNNANITSLLEIIARRELAVKVDMAEQALWAVRREHRHNPAAAAALLETLDIAGLPPELARQVFGAWAHHCARLCRQQDLLEPLRYAPDPGRGAVLARQTPDGPYLVVSALGMNGDWAAGKVVAPHLVRRARPLH